jgi:hypothetical protein
LGLLASIHFLILSIFLLEFSIDGSFGAIDN